MHRLIRHLESIGASLGALVLLAHCGGSDLTLPGPGAPSDNLSPADITIIKGDGQSGAPGTMLRDSIVVQVLDSAGAPLAGAQVEFAADAPGAAVTPETSATGADGMTGARWVLGEITGEQRVVARVVGDSVSDSLQVTFTASAEAAPLPVPVLALRTQPSGSATIGVEFRRQPELQIRDQQGKDIKEGGVRVTAAVASGDGALGGTTSRLTDSKGRAEFTDLRINGATGSHILIFAADGYTSVSSAPIDVEPPADQSPIVVADEYNTTEGHDRTLAVSAVDGVLRNDRDPEGGQLTASLVSNTPNGSVTLNSDGSFSYNPIVNFFGDDRFTYRASDPAGNSSNGVVTIHVAPVNDPPQFSISVNPVIAPAGQIPQVVANFATGITPGGSDNETEQVLTFEVIGNSNPALFASPPVVTRDGQGSTATLTFTPAAGQIGGAFITIVLKDNGGVEFGGFDTSPPQSFTIVVQ